MPDSAPLLVFADDWGRHPSSCQHLVRHLLPWHDVVWVNTIMRPPRLNLATMRRGWEKVRQWRAGNSFAQARSASPRVLNPRMWPWFSSPLDRRFNRWLLARQLKPVIESLGELPIAVTTLPIVADLVGTLPVARWVYYCVDDFSVWPGLDGDALRFMEQQLVREVDEVIAVSETLCAKLEPMGRASHFLSHGIDPEHWSATTFLTEVPAVAALQRPLVVFWGVIDRRMDMTFIRRLVAEMSQGHVVLAGPLDNPDPDLLQLPRVIHTGSLPFEQLPAMAREASVLIMPYADLPVTQAMQPLKLKEYLATGKPVVARDLPANREWADCLDLAHDPQSFSEQVRLRIRTGLPEDQSRSRHRLASESWANKAKQFRHLVTSGIQTEAQLKAVG